MWVVFAGSEVVFERPSFEECDLFVKERGLRHWMIVDKEEVNPCFIERWDSLRVQRERDGNLQMLHLHECQLGRIESRRKRSEQVNTLVETLVESLVEDLRVTLHDRLTEMLLKEPLEELAVG